MLKFTVRPGRPEAEVSGHERERRCATARMGGALPPAAAGGAKCRGDDPGPPEGAGNPASDRPTRPTPGTSTSTTAMSTTTTRPTTTGSVSCAAERESAGDGRGRDGGGPFSLLALWRAYRACRRGKRKARDTQGYEARLLDRLAESRDALASFGWRPSRAFCFVVFAPKLREIHAAPFADRVVHHLLVERLNRLFEPVFIDDSCANRKGKGTHAAVARLQRFMRRLDGGGEAFFLQLDIANFFNRIHRPTLFRLLQHRLARAVRRGGLAREEARALQAHCRALLTAAPGAGAAHRGPPRHFARVPPHKRLSMQEKGRGLPTGNLTSQLFANVYLNELDQFVKHTLKARFYLRYVDDFILLHRDPAQLRVWRDAIERFLQERLALSLKARGEPKPLGEGADFLGYVVRPRYRLVRRRIVRRFSAQLREFARRHRRGGAWNLPPAACGKLRAQLASFRAHLAHAGGTRVWRRLWDQNPWLAELFAAPAAGGLPLPRPLWEPASVSGVAGQYRYFVRAHPGACVLMQIGSRWWTEGRWARLAAAGAIDAVRPGLGAGIELTSAALARMRRALRRAGIGYALVAQTGFFRSGFRRRALVFRRAGD